MEQRINSYLEDLEANGGERRLCFATVILERRTDYPRIKALLTRLGLLS